MKVFFDDQIFQMQATGGISRYFCELARQFARADGIQPVLFGGISRNLYLQELDRLPRLKKIHRPRRDQWRINTWIERVSRLWRRLAFLSARRRGGPIVYHPTFYDVDNFIARRADATVVTYFDMIPEWLDAQRPPGTRSSPLIAQKRRALDQADALIAISESTRNDMERHYPGCLPRVFITYLATNLGELTPRVPALRPVPFFLFVGNRDSYKNGAATFEAFARVAGQRADCELICFGGKSWTPDESAWLTQRQLLARVHHVSGDDALLAGYYQQALALLYPSGYEGFGLPVLEAMQLGCPVVTARNSSLPEVGGTAAVYVDPAQPAAFAAELMSLLNEPARRAALVAQGREQSRRFSWERTATETAQIYASVLGQRRGSEAGRVV